MQTVVYSCVLLLLSLLLCFILLFVVAFVPGVTIIITKANLCRMVCF